MNRYHNIYFSQQSSLRKIRRAKAKKKSLKMIRARRPRNKKKRDRFNSVKNFQLKNHTLTIKLDENFSLLDNTEEVIEAINNISAISHETDFKGDIFIDIENVKHFDIGALGLLLSAVNSLYRSRIPVFGNVPKDEQCAKFFSDSGFLNHMQDLQGKPLHSESRNLLIERGFDRTSNQRVGTEIRNAVKYLTGLDNSYRPVYSIVQEMCANSIEHANSEKRRKNWLFATYYTENKVIFTMTDIGAGILSTLRKKAKQIVKDTITLKDEVSILSGAFDKKYQSSTFDTNRNKGLPKIKEINTFNYIENLKVITNNVLIDFNNSARSRRLDAKLKGTFYYWELTKKCIEKWQQRSILL